MSPCAFYFTDKVSKSNSTVHFLSGALVFTTILLIVLAFSILTIYNRKKCHCKGNSFFSFLLKPELYYCFVSQMTIFIYILKQNPKLSRPLTSHLKLWVSLIWCQITVKVPFLTHSPTNYYLLPKCVFIL